MNKISYQGIPFIVAKEQILKAFGSPGFAYPQYECGAFTDDLPGGPYYQLVYPVITFIGSDKESFFLEEVRFDAAGKTKLNYNGKALSGLTTRTEFGEIFGDYAKEQFEQNPESDGIILFDSESDDGGRFIFINGRLALFTYWSSC